uniref:Uncharacterized protein n=1 Tax=Lepeophtheirus salmonis TaxID=72036 RepID=A0A0K2T3C1_LEPSM
MCVSKTMYRFVEPSYCPSVDLFPDEILCILNYLPYFSLVD